MKPWAEIKREISVFSILVFLFAAGFVAWSYGYTPKVRIVPLLVGWVTLVLSILDIVVRVLPASNHGKVNAKPTKRIPPFGRPEIVAIGWLTGLLVGIYLAGFLVASIAYIGISLRLRGEKSWLSSALTSGLVTLSIWLVFSFLMNYELYPGVFFE